MLSEAEIRKQVETRLRRRGLLVLNGILWVGAAKLIYAYTQDYDFSGSEPDIIVLFMVGWLALVGLHFLHTVYVELREWLVRRAIERDAVYEKPKRLELSEDGELIDADEHLNADKRGEDSV